MAGPVRHHAGVPTRTERRRGRPGPAGPTQASPVRRVLVVGINYAPEHTGIAPYTTQAAEHLARLGHDVRVLAGVPHYPHWTVPPPYRRHLRVDEVRREGVPVRRLRHHVPARQSALRRGAYEATFALQVAASSPGAGRAGWRPDVVLTVVPSVLGALAAAGLARRAGAPLVVWVQDLMGRAAAQSGIAGGGRVAAFAGAAEAAVLRRAAAVVVLNRAFADHVVAAGVPPGAVTVLPNWTHIAPPTRDRAQVRAGLGWSDERVTVLHSGNMGLKQGLEHVVAAARLAHRRGLPLRFVLMGDGSQRARLAAAAAGLPTLEMRPPVAEDGYSDVLAAADVLLVHERPGVVNMSQPSKLTSYLVAGRPVLAAVDGTGTAADALRASGGGAVVPSGDPAALVRAALDLAVESEGPTPRASASLWAPRPTSARSLALLEALVVRAGGRG